jgi:hypothetical protein
VAKIASHLAVGALCLALGVAVGIICFRTSPAAPAGLFQTDSIDDVEVKEIAVNRVLEVVEGNRSDVSFAFQTIDRRKDGTIVAVGLLRYPFESKAKRAEQGQPPKRFWVELIPNGGTKKWKDIPVTLEYAP